MCAQLSGASIAILASAADPRIRVLDVLDPWGDWPTWTKKSPFVPEEERADYVKPEFLRKAGLLDPVQWLPKIKAQKLRLQQRTFEWETPAPAKQKLQSAVPAAGTVVSYKTMNDFLDAVGSGGEKALDWIKHEVKALPHDSPQASRSPDPVPPRPCSRAVGSPAFIDSSDGVVGAKAMLEQKRPRQQHRT